MEIGKVPNDILKKIIIDKIKIKRDEVLIRPGIGEDCCAVDFGENACVLSTDPITGAVNEIGRLAVHISCNDIASAGVEPLGLIVTLLAPPGTTESDLDTVMGQLCEAAAEINVDIIGGHTEITAAVNRFVISSTALGKVLKEKLVTTSGAKDGDCIILTKTAGLEGTAVIAHDRGNELEAVLGRDMLERARRFVDSLSVVKEGVIAGKFGVSAMHDVTEGGVLGAVWEVAEASGAGAVVEKGSIPVAPETERICSYYGINPLKLISSGCMLITCKDGEGLVKELAVNAVRASVIGRITRNPGKFISDGGEMRSIDQPEADELYKVVG